MSHKSRMPYFTILKACDKMAAGRHTYDLQSSYGQPPPARTHDAVPWVPVDPNHLLPFHKQHRRVPCTFPPQNPTKPQQVQRPGHSPISTNTHTLTHTHTHTQVPNRRQYIAKTTLNSDSKLKLSLM